MQRAIIESKTSDNLLPIESALDQFVYKKIRKEVEKLKGSDKLIAKNVLGIEVETKNIKIILRGQSKGIPKDAIKKYILPSFFISDQTLSKLLETSDVKTLMKYLLASNEVASNPIIIRIFSQIQEKHGLPLTDLEKILEKASLLASLEMQKKYLKYYNLSYVLVLLNLKWIEIKNLRRVIVGSKRKIDPSNIKSLLILQNN
jgi:vacuolar-type H+-ATPase subunit C/Vma6